MDFDFHVKLADEDGEVDEQAAGRYVDDLADLFAESPEGEQLQRRGIEPGGHLAMFLDYGFRYQGVSPAEMDAGDVREVLHVFAEKVTGRPEDLDELIPELEAFCDFVQRCFGLAAAATWKRVIHQEAADFRRAVRDPRRWGMAKSMMMEGLARGYDLSTEAGINKWMATVQAEQLAGMDAEKPARGKLGSIVDRMRQALGMPAPGSAPVEDPAFGPDALFGQPGGPRQAGPLSGGGHHKAKVKAKRKQAQASRRKNRR